MDNFEGGKGNGFWGGEKGGKNWKGGNKGAIVKLFLVLEVHDFQCHGSGVQT